MPRHAAVCVRCEHVCSVHPSVSLCLFARTMCTRTDRTTHCGCGLTQLTFKGSAGTNRGKRMVGASSVHSGLTLFHD